MFTILSGRVQTAFFGAGENNKRRQPSGRRRGSAMVFSVFLVAGLLVVSAIAIDYAHINTSRSEVKRTADAAAMSACWELYDSVLAKQSSDGAQSEITAAAASIASKNQVSSRAPQLNGESDVEVGFYDLEKPGQLETSDSAAFNAVRVHIRQTEESNSAIPLFFGSVTGRSNQSLKVHSTAAMFKAITGFYRPKSEKENIMLLPFTLDLETWNAMVAGETEDEMSVSDGVISSGTGDGRCECTLYPFLSDEFTNAGNRGTVDIGGSNNSTNDIKRQIMTGISGADMDALGHDLNCDSGGKLVLNGDTGISAGFENALESIVGETRCIPIFTKCEGNGNNAMYTIVRFEGVTICGVRLTGPMKKKHLTIQPCPMVAPLARYRTSGFTESEFLYTPVMLVE